MKDTKIKPFRLDWRFLPPEALYSYQWWCNLGAKDTKRHEIWKEILEEAEPCNENQKRVM